MPASLLIPLAIFAVILVGLVVLQRLEFRSVFPRRRRAAIDQGDARRDPAGQATRDP